MRTKQRGSNTLLVSQPTLIGCCRRGLEFILKKASIKMPDAVILTALIPEITVTGTVRNIYGGQIHVLQNKRCGNRIKTHTTILICAKKTAKA